MEERTAPLRIGYELTGAALDAAGGRRSALGLLGALRARDDVEVLELAQPRAGAGVTRALDRELRWMPRGLPRATAGLDLLHCPLPLVPPRSPVPLVATVHDTLALDRPEWFTRANAWYSRRVLPGRLRRAARVVCPSEHTREAVVRTFGVEESLVHVAPWGVDAHFRPGPRDEALLRRLGVNGEYLLAVGTLQPRKNLEVAIAAFEAVAAGRDLRLLIAGARGWHAGELLARLERSPAAAHIVLVGEIPDDELAALYRGAECLVFPSLGEGFGLPALEAMASGTPVVVSDRGALPEVVGDAGLVVSPSRESVAAALGRLLSDPAKRSELAARGLRRAAEFSWDRCAALTLDAYRGAVGG